jgi:hypothetical protein
MKMHRIKECLPVSDAHLSGSAFDDVNFSGGRCHNVDFSAASFDDRRRAYRCGRPHEIADVAHPASSITCEDGK